MEEQFREDFLCYFMPMLQDSERNKLYERAIKKIVFQFTETHGYAPSVLDVGTGTGMLSIFAAAAGASRVVGLEANKLRARIARKNVRAYPWRICKVDIVHCESTKFVTKTPFDIVICELMATFVHGEDMNKYISDLYQRNIVRTFGDAVYCIPARAQLWLQKYKLSTCDDGEIFMRKELIKRGTGQFAVSQEYGIFPHSESLHPVGKSIQLFDQPIHKPVELNSVETELEENCCLVAEWRCRLFDDIVLNHTVNSVSRLSPYEYHMRMNNWGFKVFATSKTQKFTVRVTDDDLKVTCTKRKRE